MKCNTSKEKQEKKKSASRRAFGRGEPAAAETGRRRHVALVSPREHRTPAILQRLAPPGMSFGLDQKAHRFTVKFKVKPREGHVWAAYGPGGSRPKAFQHTVCPGKRH